MSLTPNAFDKELGTGVVIYFKLLRYLGLMFLLFTLISVPTYFICGLHGQSNLTDEKKTGLGSILSSFSVGNVGKSSMICDSIPIPKGQNLDDNALRKHFKTNKVVTCPYGDPKYFAEIGLINTTCASRGQNWKSL